MDERQVETLRSRYAGMDDDQLALLVATRRDELSDEARTALAAVLKSKNISAFVDEVNATVSDLNAQARAAGEEVARQRERDRRARRAMLLLCAFVALLAAGMATFYAKD